ncbi:2-dehydropantoate 2-reductase [Chitinophaga sedimenti]|uniref:ketopantoate reductase family protein n=1 Tax=Chitinophaga sedimenti TaxID=2033606 RepID=UPI0020059584|nr:2-dehydropantoate 2-reductase [Chitinophaga sedimenti]MCK7554018.1 2-dehydropantoate 2-reductase [Chitinophaga sedimenti]
MHIYIIGAGAIGKALAVVLHTEGRSVTLIRGSVDNGVAEQMSIRVLLPDESIIEAPVEMQTLSAFSTLDGIVVLTNKSFGNARLSHSLRAKCGSSPIVLLQNGLGVEQPFIDQEFNAIYRCVLFVTSQSENTHTVRFRPVADCPVGTITGLPQERDRIVAALTTPHFRFVTEQNIQPIIWKKAIINSVFNSVCPLLETDNGIFHRNEAALDIARTVIAECLSVAALQGIELDAHSVEQSLLQISRLSDGQLISTLQDIRAHRETEIDTLNLAIARMATHPVVVTNLLGALTKLKSTLTRL